MKGYVINILAAFSVMLNVITGGSYRNTFSARVGYGAHVNGSKFYTKIARIIDAILGDKHCYLEYINEKCSFYSGKSAPK